jgi:tetratricopeptide (TPR) repeat protein
LASAVACYERALSNQLALGRVRAAAASVNDIAAVYFEQGRYAEALTHREIGGVGTDFVTALDAYGHTLLALGQQGEAFEAWGEAVLLAESQSDPRAAQLRERLALADAADVVSRR